MSQFHLRAGQEAASSPFCYCSGQSDSPTDSKLSAPNCFHNLLVKLGPVGLSGNACTCTALQTSAIMSAGCCSLLLWGMLVMAASTSLHRVQQGAATLWQCCYKARRLLTQDRKPDTNIIHLNPKRLCFA